MTILDMVRVAIMSVVENWIDDLGSIDLVARNVDMENQVDDHVRDRAAKAILHADDHTHGTDDKHVRI